MRESWILNPVYIILFSLVKDLNSVISLDIILLYTKEIVVIYTVLVSTSAAKIDFWITRLPFNLTVTFIVMDIALWIL